MALHDPYIKVFADPTSSFQHLLGTTDLQQMLQLLTLTVEGLVVICAIALLALAYTLARPFFAPLLHRKYRVSPEFELVDYVLQRQAENQAAFQDDLRSWVTATRAMQYPPPSDQTDSRLRKWSTEELYALFDSLSPTEIALWMFTSPNRLSAPSPTPLGPSRITATTKEAYLWAAAVAYVLEDHPNVEDAEILHTLERVIRDTVKRNVDCFSGWRLSALPNHEQERLIEQFVRGILGRGVEFAQIEKRAQEAYETLLWRGLIEDPLWKEIGGSALVVAMVFPIQWSNTNDYLLYESLSFRYTQEQSGDHVDRKFKVRVKEVSNAVMHEIVPSFLKIVTELAESQEDSIERPASQARDQIRLGSPAARLQRALKEAGFDPGPIDGIFQQRSRSALKAFQQSRDLPATGVPDEKTVRMLGLRPNTKYTGTSNN